MGGRDCSGLSLSLLLMEDMTLQMLSVCVCVCVYVRERQREREGRRGRDEERDREREISLPIHNSPEMLLDPSYIFIHSFNKYMLNTYFALSILRVGYIPEFFI